MVAVQRMPMAVTAPATESCAWATEAPEQHPTDTRAGRCPLCSMTRGAVGKASRPQGLGLTLTKSYRPCQLARVHSTAHNIRAEAERCGRYRSRSSRTTRGARRLTCCMSVGRPSTVAHDWCAPDMQTYGRHTSRPPAGPPAPPPPTMGVRPMSGR